VAFNSLWPKTIIATSAIEFAIGSAEIFNQARNAKIMADAAFEILSEDHREVTGQYFIDEVVLREKGYTDFEIYKMNPATKDEELIPDFFI
jgi:citronellol/citronellal dehydrogenase